MPAQNPFAQISTPSYTAPSRTISGISQTPPQEVPNTSPQHPQVQSNAIWIESMDEVLNYPTAPSTQMYFFDRNNPIIWMRETDNNGNIKNPIHRMTFSAEEVPFGPEAHFVTKEEHQKLFDAVNELNSKIDAFMKKWD